MRSNLARVEGAIVTGIEHAAGSGLRKLGPRAWRPPPVFQHGAADGLLQRRGVAAATGKKLGEPEGTPAAAASTPDTGYIQGWRRRLGTESGRGRAETKLTLCVSHDIMRNVGGPAKKPRKLDGCRVGFGLGGEETERRGARRRRTGLSGGGVCRWIAADGGDWIAAGCGELSGRWGFCGVGWGWSELGKGEKSSERWDEKTGVETGPAWRRGRVLNIIQYPRYCIIYLYIYVCVCVYIYGSANLHPRCRILFYTQQ
jgi:hypothetical protein